MSDNENKDADQWHEIARESLRLAQGFQDRFSNQLEKLIETLSAVSISLAKVENDAHKWPCKAHVELVKLQREDVADLHEKVNSHIKDGHAENIKATVSDRREDHRDSRNRIELIIIAAGILASILISIFK